MRPGGCRTQGKLCPGGFLGAHDWTAVGLGFRRACHQVRDHLVIPLDGEVIETELQKK